MAPSHKSEVQVQKSPAEFFAENQAIAGFDNMGKSLYTTIRELVENSLDACESVGVLPEIHVDIEELTQAEFNVHRGLASSPSKQKRKDEDLFATKQRKSTGKSESTSSKTIENAKGDGDGSATKKKGRSRRDTEAYFLIKVKDNGCGMAHDAIPNLLGRVLSGSKYGVRQTRGKFGLGAKMALIWSKKSTGVPISVTSAHMKKPGQVASHVSRCVLDIDIYKNAPRIIQHKKQPNKNGYVGTEFEVLIAGNWTTYKARIVQYLQQLAIITPYAQLELSYQNRSDPKKTLKLRHDRRSEQMPEPAKEVKHHPSSVNNLLVQQLLERSKCDTIVKFLTKDLSSVSVPIAKRLVAELGMDEDLHPSEITDKQITKLVQVLRSATAFKAPDASCLSPLGEYNLSLGIRKVLEPDLVATARDKASAYEGHPFLIEAAVSLGGKECKEGLTVVRFANRIPLLFEAGADVATRVAQSKIRWASYKMDLKRDKIGVFVSIVSTKVPFKGTGKEYIGDDITEIQASVKRALQSCCQQLRVHLTKKHAEKDLRERRSRLVKYVPDVSRSLFSLLNHMKERQEQESEDGSDDDTGPSSANKRLRVHGRSASDILRRLESKEITETTIKKDLIEAIEAQGAKEDEVAVSPSKRRKGIGAEPQPIFLVHLPKLDSTLHDIHHPLFTFRPIRPVPDGSNLF